MMPTSCNVCSVGNIISLPFDEDVGFCDSCGAYHIIRKNNSFKFKDIHSKFELRKRDFIINRTLSPLQTRYVSLRIAYLIKRLNDVERVISLYPKKSIDGRIDKNVVSCLELCYSLSRYISNDKVKPYKEKLI